MSLFTRQVPFCVGHRGVLEGYSRLDLHQQLPRSHCGVHGLLHFGNGNWCGMPVLPRRRLCGRQACLLLHQYRR